MCHTSKIISVSRNLGSVVVRRGGLAALLLVATMAGGAFAAGPTLSVRDISLPAGRTFTQPLDGSDPQGAPLSFSIVSISDAHLGASLTNGNRSLRLAMSGKDGTGSNVTGDVVLELFEDLTPLTCERIIQLVNSGYYDGLTFHRVIQNFMAQGGDPLGNGLGGSGQTLDDELVSTSALPASVSWPWRTRATIRATLSFSLPTPIWYWGMPRGPHRAGWILATRSLDR